MAVAIVDRAYKRRGILPIHILGIGSTEAEASFNAENVHGHDMFNVDRLDARPIRLKPGQFYHFHDEFGKPIRHQVNDGFTR